MADETVDPTQPATPADPTPEPAQEPAPAAPAPDPAVQPVPADPAAPAPAEAFGPEAAVTPDPSGPTPTTSSDDAAVPVGNAPEDAPVVSASVQPVVVDNYTKRNDDDALNGSWVDVISGPLAGRFGAYVDTVHHDDSTGYPSVILIRSRDERNELLEVAYSDVRPSERTGGR